MHLRVGCLAQCDKRRRAVGAQRTDEPVVHDPSDRWSHQHRDRRQRRHDHLRENQSERGRAFEVDHQKPSTHPGGLCDRANGGRRRQMMKRLGEHHQVIGVVVGGDLGGVDNLGAHPRMGAEFTTGDVGD